MISEWTKQFLKSKDSPSSNIKAGSTKPKPVEGMTFANAKETIDLENCYILIEKISASVNINHPKVVWELEINKIRIENIAGGVGPIMLFEDNNPIILELFSLDMISIRSNRQSNGYIQGISLQANLTQGEFNLSIEKVYKESPTQSQSPILHINKALVMKLSFKEDLLQTVLLKVGSLDFDISYSDFSQEFGSFSMFNNMLAHQKGEIPQAITDLIFEKNIFEKIRNELARKKTQTAQTKKPDKIISKFGPFATHNSYHFQTVCENISVRCFKNNTVSVFKLCFHR